MAEGYQALTEKEKQTLRLLLDGHDAKSMARQLELSVHTINERLRDARRKLAVSSSKEAARVVREIEAANPERLGDKGFGDAETPSIDQQSDQPVKEPRRNRYAVWVIGGFVMITVFAAILAAFAPGVSPTPERLPEAVAQAPAVPSDAATTALNWLALLDESKWAESWSATSASFRSLNTVAAWQAASEKARSPLGRVLSRKLLSEQDTPAPPRGYRTVRFQTDFTNKKGVIETLSLEQEGDSWTVVGIYIE